SRGVASVVPVGPDHSSVTDSVVVVAELDEGPPVPRSDIWPMSTHTAPARTASSRIRVSHSPALLLLRRGGCCCVRGAADVRGAGLDARPPAAPAAPAIPAAPAGPAPMRPVSGGRRNPGSVSAPSSLV